MEKEYLKITPWFVEKELGLGILICPRSTSNAWIYHPDLDNPDEFLKVLEIALEEGFLRSEYIKFLEL